LETRTQLGSRENNFDFIRLTMALLVIFSHSYPLATGFGTDEFFFRITRAQLSGGSIAVDVFFFVSGYLITSSFQHSKSVWVYLKKRVFRIYPAFIALSLVDLVIVLPLSRGHLIGGSPTQVWLFLWEIISLNEFISVGAFKSNPLSGVINGSLWTIRYEFFCYLGLAILGVFGFLLSKRRTLLLFCLSLIATICITSFGLSPYGLKNLHPAGSENLDFFLRLVPMYLSGVVAYLYRDRIRLNLLWAALACLVLFVAVWITNGMLTAMPLAGSYLSIFVAYHPKIHFHHFARFGDFSYGTYLYAFPVQQVIVCMAKGVISPLLLFALATPVTLTIAVISWHLIEKRFLSQSRVSQQRGFCR
jgi:peptidoglycan/LPS O-acetylase OafA/YrhL